MRPVHGFGLILLMVAMYLVGVKFPTFGATLLGKVGM
jgi:hypothetical protein